jgi:hypothetical protein
MVNNALSVYIMFFESSSHKLLASKINWNIAVTVIAHGGSYFQQN